MDPMINANTKPELSQLCRNFRKLLLSFAGVLDRESQAISRSDLIELEAITGEKEAFGAKLEELARKIRTEIQSLAGRAGAELEDIKLEDLCHSPALMRLDPLLRQELMEEIQLLSEARQATFPKIEANAYLVQKLLQYHRETYFFWQAVAKDSESTYGEKGKPRSTQQTSILTVRT